jgi:hypothetical protein
LYQPYKNGSQQLYVGAERFDEVGIGGVVNERANHYTNYHGDENINRQFVFHKCHYTLSMQNKVGVKVRVYTKASTANRICPCLPLVFGRPAASFPHWPFCQRCTPFTVKGQLVFFCDVQHNILVATGVPLCQFDYSYYSSTEMDFGWRFMRVAIIWLLLVQSVLNCSA